MPFQGTPNSGGVNPIALALQIRQMRNREKLQNEKLRIDRINALSASKIAQAKEMREAQKDALDIETKRADLAAKLPGLSEGVVEAQRSASQEFTPGDLSIQGAPQESAEFASIVAQNAPASIARANEAQAVLGDRVGSAARARLAVSGGTPQEAIQSTLGAAASSRRQAQREIIADRVKADEASDRANRLAIKAENRALARDGIFKKSELIGIHKEYAKSLEPINQLNDDWAAFERASASKNRFDPLELIQRWVRNVDPGATVREGDIDLVRFFGVSTYDELLARWGGFTDAEKKIPDELKPKLLESFGGILRQRDREFSDRIGDMSERANQLGWDDRERRIAIPANRSSRRLMQRVEGADFAGIQVPEIFRTNANAKEATRRASSRIGVPPGSISPAEASIELKKMFAESQSGGAR